MPSRDYEYRFRAKDDTSAVADKMARGVGRAFKSIADDIDESASKGKQFAQVLRQTADVAEQEARSAERAISALADALGDDLTISARQAFDALEAGGLTVEEIEADADELADALKRIDQAAASAGDGVRTSMSGAAKGLDDVALKGDQSRSVLANMAGNAASELPGVAGAIGPINVGLGQLVEYAADGNISLRGLAQVAGPLALVGVGIAAITAVMAENNKRAERARQIQEAYTEALLETDDAMAVLSTTADNFLDSDAIDGALRMGANLEVLANAVTDASINFETLAGPVDDFLQATAEGNISAGELSDAFDRMGITSSPLTDELLRLAAAGELNVGNYHRLISELSLLNSEYEDSEGDVEKRRAIEEALGIAIGETGEKAGGTLADVKSLSEQYEDLATAADGARDALDGAADGITRVHQASLGVLDANVAYQEAIDALAESIRGAAEDGSEYNDTLDDTTERGRANIQNAQQVAAAVTGLIAERLRETGSLEEARRAGELYIEQLKDQLRQAGLTEDEVSEYLDTLNLTPEDVSTTIALAGAEQSQQFVETYSEQLDGLSGERRTEILALINAGAYNQAADLLDALAGDRLARITPDVTYTSRDDSGKAVQRLASGGVVEGPYRGAAVPVVAHAGEVVLNEAQQAAVASGLSEGNAEPFVVNFNGPVYGADAVARGVQRARRRVQMLSRM